MALSRIKNTVSKNDEIHSNQILGSIIFFSFCLHLIIFLFEIIIDFKLISTVTLLPVLIISFFIVVAYLLDVYPNALGFCNILLFYLSIELHFLNNPYTYHFIIYWFTFVVILAVISGGIMQSFFWLGMVLFTIAFDFWYLTNHYGLQYALNVPLIHTSVGGILFLGGIFLFICIFHWLLSNAYLSMKQKSAELEKLRIIADKKGKTLEKYQEAHFQMSGDISIIDGQFENLYKKICKLAYENIGVSRISIWTFGKHTSILERRYLHDHSGGTVKYESILMEDYPAYFKAITTKKYIVADDAYQHPETKDLSDTYLKPLQIYSLLDCPFMVDGKLKGIISCEHQYTHRQWAPADILFVQSLSDFISLSHKSHETQSLLHQIQSQNEELLEQRHEIESMNEQLSGINETLEQKVQERTHELELQNQTLTEYAFINSHQLRAPLSRILGLSYLISKNLSDKNDTELIKALITSTQELDKVVNKISRLLYDGNSFGRDDIRELIDKDLRKEKH